MDLLPVLVGAAGLLGAGVALYRARVDKTAVKVGTDATLMQAAVATAKGLAEASAMVVEPLRQELSSARERLAVVEKHARNCDEKLDTLSQKFAGLESTVLLEAREARVEAHSEVAAQAKERERVQERDGKIDEASG